MKKFYTSFLITITLVYIFSAGLFAFDKHHRKNNTKLKTLSTSLPKEKIKQHQESSQDHLVSVPEIQNEATGIEEKSLKENIKAPSEIKTQNSKTLKIISTIKVENNIDDKATEKNINPEASEDVKKNQEIKALSEMTEDELFSLILTNPSSLEANLELAIKQLLSRNLKGASITLDRILQLYPGNAKAELLLAETELKLENIFSAKNLFKDVINNEKATDEQKRIAGEYLTKLYDAEEKWKFFATGLLSQGRSKNPINSPRYVTIFGDSYSNPQFDDSADNFTEIYTSIGVKYFLESQTESIISPSINYYQRKYDKYKTADLSNLAFNLTYENEFMKGRNILVGSYGKTELNKKPYVDSYSVSLNHKHILFNDLLANVGIVVGQNNHQECDNCASSNSRTNFMSGANLNLNTTLVNSVIMEMNASYNNFDANEKYESYQIGQLSGALGYASRFGLIQASTNFSSSKYGDVDPLALIKRKIDTQTVGASFVTALPYFDMPKKNDWMLKLNIQKGNSDSKIETYKRDIEESSLSLIKSF